MHIEWITLVRSLFTNHLSQFGYMFNWYYHWIPAWTYLRQSYLVFIRWTASTLYRKRKSLFYLNLCIYLCLEFWDRILPCLAWNLLCGPDWLWTLLTLLAPLFRNWRHEPPYIEEDVLNHLCLCKIFLDYLLIYHLIFLRICDIGLVGY